jgi:hypothetical protein
MAYFLRFLILVMLLALTLTGLTAKGLIHLSVGHIQLAIPVFLFMIFVQAFVMFYFIGVARLVENIHRLLSQKKNLEELFEQPPADLKPYLKKVKQFHYDSTVGKRQTIPWTMLMLTLGTMAFLLGGAHDTGMVSRTIHVGVVYGFFAATVIGFSRQWYFLGKGHKLLRELKKTFSLADQSM